MFTSSRLAALTCLLVVFVAAGCNKSGGSSSLEEYAPSPQLPDYRSISGTATGLTGVLTLGTGNGTVQVTTSTFTVSNAFENGDDVVLSIVAQPDSQQCTIDTQTTFTGQQDNIVGVGISCITLNEIRVSVENFYTGAAMAGINVSATWNDGTQQVLNGVTDAEGNLIFTLPTFDGRVIVNADPAGYGEQSKVVINTSQPAGRTARMLMQPNVLATSFDAADGADLTVAGDVLISIPANAMADANGDPYAGSVSVELTIVDPTLDVDLMPGDYLSQQPGGSIGHIQSYGALSVTFTGAAGEVLDLAAGQTATVNVPVAEAERSGPPSSVPLFYYNPTTGYWIEEGSATTTALGSGTLVYTGQVSHFTTWNADQEYDPIFLSGCVVNSSGQPFPNVRVDGTGSSYLGSTRAITDSSGQFSLPLRPLSTALVTVGDGLQSGTIDVSTSNVNLSVSECLVASAGASTISLTWGQDPRDLDTRLYGFSDVDSMLDFEVNYTNRSETVNNITIDLDVDDVSSFGPEVTTFPDFPFSGVYRYTVHLFSGSGSIQASLARVELNLRGDVSVFTPPGGTPTECWAVVDLRVDPAGNVTVVELGTWEAEAYCTSGAFTNPTTFAPPRALREVDSASNPLTRLIERKYYAD